ncbi:hypothetical protein BD410DRAFT_767184 [Rickenella mellea]|uniref:Uncharacterized protein n=1 Tax=Rickenella mellea TaxID=50990 RepID=A0A4Y7QBM4_9AGAM|nr:hypothetical protein BD410DRAFT_767184 [Rickenella mellea]
MAHSLSPECTPLKQEYDTCFNAWFEGYLQPVVAATPELRAEQTAAKTEEYNQKCGKIWESYRDCVQQRAVKAKGLEDLLGEARKENPLTKPPPPPPADAET